MVGAAQALARVVAAPTAANFFEAIADGAILTLIVAPACAAIAAFAYEAWCSVQLGLIAAFLPYTISPYSSRNPNAAARESLVSKAMKARAMHRRFARIKAARTYAGEVCAQFATAAVEAPRRALAVALALKAFSARKRERGELVLGRAVARRLVRGVREREFARATPRGR